MKTTTSLFLTAFFLCTTGLDQWTPQQSGTTARFRGVSAVSPTVAWASGAGFSTYTLVNPVSITKLDRAELNSNPDKIINIVEKVGFNRVGFMNEVRRALQRTERKPDGPDISH